MYVYEHTLVISQLIDIRTNMFEKPFEDYTDLAIAVALGVISALIFFNTNTQSYQKYLWYVVATLPIALLCYQSLHIDRPRKYIRLFMRLGTSLIIMSLMLIILGAVLMMILFAAQGDQKAKPGETTAEYLSRREREKQMAEGAVGVGGIAIGAGAFVIGLLGKYAVLNPSFTPVLEWLPKR